MHKCAVIKLMCAVIKCKLYSIELSSLIIKIAFLKNCM